VAVIQDLIPEAQKHGRGVMQGTWKGIIANNPSAFGKQVYVIIPDISKDHRWGPCNWQPQDNMNLPVVGNSCLVVFDNQRAPWVSNWWTGQPPNVQNGKWVHGVGGAAIWDAIGPADVGGAGLVYAGGSSGAMGGPWPKSWTVTLPKKSDVTLTVSASIYTDGAGSAGMNGFMVNWDGSQLPCYADMFFNETLSHKMLTVTNTIRGAAAGPHTIQVAAPSAYPHCASDANDRATFSAICVAVP